MAKWHSKGKVCITHGLKVFLHLKQSNPHEIVPQLLQLCSVCHPSKLQSYNELAHVSYDVADLTARWTLCQCIINDSKESIYLDL